VHTHVMLGNNLSSGLYTGEFGLVYIEPNHDPGSYDQEVFLATHEFEPFCSTSEMEEEDGKPEDPALANEVSADKTQKSNGWETGYQTFTVNGRCLGYGVPMERGLWIGFRPTRPVHCRDGLTGFLPIARGSRCVCFPSRSWPLKCAPKIDFTGSRDERESTSGKAISVKLRTNTAVATSSNAATLARNCVVRSAGRR
jgi:hypothetical protein